MATFDIRFNNIDYYYSADITKLDLHAFAPREVTELTLKAKGNLSLGDTFADCSAALQGDNGDLSVVGYNFDEPLATGYIVDFQAGYGNNDELYIFVYGIDPEIGSAVEELFSAIDSVSLVDDRAFIARMFSGNDSMFFEAGNDIFRGYSGNDIMKGLAGNDKLWGDAGRDTIFGGTGKDTLFGGADNDSLSGGIGADTLNGGVGSDKFIYNSVSERGDSVINFDRLDFFQFEGSKFSLGSYSGHLKSANFIAQTSGHVAVDANDFFIFDQKLDQLWFDADGSGAKGAILIAHLSNNFALLSADILVV